MESEKKSLRINLTGYIEKKFSDENKINFKLHFRGSPLLFLLWLRLSFLERKKLFIANDE